MSFTVRPRHAVLYKLPFFFNAKNGFIQRRRINIDIFVFLINLIHKLSRRLIRVLA